MTLPAVLIQCTKCLDYFTPEHGLDLPLACECGRKFMIRTKYFDRGEWIGWEGTFKGWYVTSDKREIKDLLDDGEES